MKTSSSSGSSALQPSGAILNFGKILIGIVPEPMQPWRIAGFVDGLVCGLGAAPDQAFSSEEDPEDALFLDCIDEVSRDAEEKDCPLLPEDIAHGSQGADLKAALISLVRDAETAMASNEGFVDLPFTDADISPARAYAQGFLRGLVMSIEDEDELADERYGEVLGLLFILTEDDLGAEFGSAADVREARASVIAALPGLVSQLWSLSHEEEE